MVWSYTFGFGFHSASSSPWLSSPNNFTGVLEVDPNSATPLKNSLTLTPQILAETTLKLIFFFYGEAILLLNFKYAKNLSFDKKKKSLFISKDKERF